MTTLAEVPVQANNDVVILGVVTKFDAVQGFGFAQGADGNKYHFYVNHRRHMITFGVKGRRKLKGGSQIKFVKRVYFNDNPAPGDRIIFKVVPPKQHNHRPSASPWAFAP